ncbi:hypothetical protein SEVIR_4G052701v4 [Setaria viridis]
MRPDIRASTSGAGDGRRLLVDPGVEEVDCRLAARERVPEPVAEGLDVEPPVLRRPALADELLGGLQVPVRLWLVEDHQRHPLPAARHHAVRRRPERRVAHDLHLVADDHQQLAAAEPHGHVHPPATVLEHLEPADVAVQEERRDHGVVGVGLQPVHELRPRAGRVVGEARVRGHLVADAAAGEELLVEAQGPRHGPEHLLGNLLAPKRVLVEELPERRRVGGPETQPPLLLRLDMEVEPVAPVEDLLVGVHAVDAVAFVLELAAVGLVGVVQLLLRRQVEELQPSVVNAVEERLRDAMPVT